MRSSSGAATFFPGRGRGAGLRCAALGCGLQSGSRRCSPSRCRLCCRRGCRRVVANVGLGFRGFARATPGGDEAADSSVTVEAADGGQSAHDAVQRVHVALWGGDSVAGTVRLCARDGASSSAHCEAVADALLSSTPYAPLLSPPGHASAGRIAAGAPSAAVQEWAQARERRDALVARALTSPLRLPRADSSDGEVKGRGDGAAAVRVALHAFDIELVAWFGRGGHDDAPADGAGYGSVADFGSLMSAVEGALQRQQQQQQQQQQRQQQQQQQRQPGHRPGLAAVRCNASPRVAAEAAPMGRAAGPPSLRLVRATAWRAAVALRARPDADAATADVAFGVTVVLLRRNNTAPAHASAVAAMQRGRLKKLPVIARKRCGFFRSTI